MCAENLSADSNEHDLLGFPGVKAEPPKIYLRRLWLPAENDRTTYPRFYDTTINDMAQLANRVVNSLANDAARRNEELQGGAFLKCEANWILELKGYGRRIWSEDCGANTRLKSNLGGTYPRWGALTASGGYVENDQELIKLTFRHWMAARLQNKIDAPRRAARRPAKINEGRQNGPGSHQHEVAREELPYRESLPLHPPDSGTAEVVQEASLCTYDDELAFGMAWNSPEKDPGTSDIELSQNHNSLKRRRSNANEKIDVERRLQTPEIVAAARPCSPKLADPAVAGTQTVITKASPTRTSLLYSCPAVSALPNCTDVVSKVEHEASPYTHRNLSVTNLEEKLQHLLTDITDSVVMSHEMISVAQCLYRESPHRHPHDDWYNDFRVLSQALDHWEHLIAQAPTADNARSSPEDLLPKFIAGKLAEGRLRVFRRLRAQMQPPFSFDTWTIALALLFEGLLPRVGIPSSFEDMVYRLRTALQHGESTRPGSS